MDFAIYGFKKGMKPFNFKGNNACYTAFHIWLRSNYGNPKNCTHCGKGGKKGIKKRWNIDWALKKGYHHTHKVENYIGLCRSCHMKYDMTEEKRKFMTQIAIDLVKSIKRDKKGRLLKMYA